VTTGIQNTERDKADEEQANRGPGDSDRDAADVGHARPLGRRWRRHCGTRGRTGPL